MEIEKLMRQSGRSLKDYPEIQLPSTDEIEELGNRLINEEQNYDRDSQRSEHLRIMNNLNPEQKKAYDAIMESVDKGLGKQIFVDGYGGTGKTYLWRAITTKLRSEGKIVIAVASCGIAALLLQGGRTAHSRFKIPINITDESTCEIKQGTHLAELLKKTSLILWDEAPMANRNCFEALDHSHRNRSRWRVPRPWDDVPNRGTGSSRVGVPFLSGSSLPCSRTAWIEWAILNNGLVERWR